MAVSVGSGLMLLLCVRMYCIFSTLPLDVKNTVIRTQSLKVTVSVRAGLILLFWVLRRQRFFCGLLFLLGN